MQLARDPRALLGNGRSCARLAVALQSVGALGELLGPRRAIAQCDAEPPDHAADDAQEDEVAHAGRWLALWRRDLLEAQQPGEHEDPDPQAGDRPTALGVQAH